MSKNPLLSDADVARYHDQGFVVPDFRLPDGLVQEMKQAYDELLNANSHLSSDFLLGPHLLKPGTQGVRGNQKWFDFATYEPLMDMASQLIGEDIILWGTTIFGKPAYSGKETPWHQDGDYYPIRPLETLTIWIALDDVTAENGPMRFIPGSHKSKRSYRHHWRDADDLTINLTCDVDQFDESAAVDLILEAGQLSFHDVYMIHGSAANNTPSRRAAFIVRLMPATSLYDHELGEEMGAKHSAHDYGKRPLFLVRGQDRSGNNFDIGH
ncbi:MAG: phytanoyl-CoA dioxygenase family protein [Pseudomonadota bacterium]